MTSRCDTAVSPPWWGASAAGERGPARRWSVRGGLALDLLGAAAMLAVWVMVWTFFIVAVAGPAARLHGTGRREAVVARESVPPALAVTGAGSQQERSRP